MTDLERLTEAIETGTVRIEVAAIRPDDLVILHFDETWDPDTAAQLREEWELATGIPAVSLPGGMTVEIKRQEPSVP